MNPHRSLRRRWNILILHGKGLFRTDFDTKTAYATFETIDFPFLGLLRDNNGVSRTPPAARAAEDALINVVFDPAPGNCSKGPLPLRVHEGCRSLHQIIYYRPRHRKGFHALAPYLSVQLIQGSRVMIILGISPTCDPFIILIIAGIFEKVGTLTRSRKDRWRFR